jgi:glycosyltransferase involved in cell wall biosynthesis
VAAGSTVATHMEVNPLHPSVLDAFAREFVTHTELEGKSVLEVGACDVNGSIRPIIESHRPSAYVGVDASPGPRVDRVIDAGDLVAVFGWDAFDVVITTEMLEHVADWRRVIGNLAGVVRPGGVLALTTRSPGFPYHGYPDDFWRYTPEVMGRILTALGLEVLELRADPDPASPGVFAKATKPAGWQLPPEDALLEPDVQPARVEARPLSILGYPHDSDGSGYYRFYLPYKFLARGVSHQVMLPEPHTKFTPNDEQLHNIDVIAVQRFMGADGVELFTRWRPRVTLVYETDDDMLHPDNASGLAHLHDEATRETFRRCLRMAHMVTVSTPTLAEVLRPYNDNIRILPNFVHGDMLYIERPRRDRLTVGWAGGMSHLLDWSTAAEPINDVLDTHPDVDFHFVGIDYSPLLRRACRYTPWRPDVWDYYAELDFDVGVVPLADTPFNRCKSHIKALEFMALGIPVVAADAPAYRELVIDGVTGYLVRTADEWRARLHDLLHDEAMRQEMGAKGKQVAAEWTMQTGWKLWRDAYEDVTGWQP